MKLTSGVSKAQRQLNALKRLQAQLSSGVKTKKGTKDEKTPLSDYDIKRINKEIQNIETKLKDRFSHLLEEPQTLAA